MGLGNFLKGFSGKQGLVSKGNLNVSVPLSQFQGSFKVKEIYSIVGIGQVIVGEVLSGQLCSGMFAELNNKKIEIKVIEANHQRLSVANIGEQIGMSLKNATKEDFQKEQIITFFKKS